MDTIGKWKKNAESTILINPTLYIVQVTWIIIGQSLQNIFCAEQMSKMAATTEKQ